MSKKEKLEKLYKELKGLNDEWIQEAKKIKVAGSEEAMNLKRLYLGKMAIPLKEAGYIEKGIELSDIKFTPVDILSPPDKPDEADIGKASSTKYEDYTATTITFEDSYVLVAWKE